MAVCGQVGDTNEMTMAKMKDTSVILFARFSYDECRTQIPVLIKREEGYHAIYPYLSCYPRESEAFRMKLNDLIAQKAGISIVSHEIIYIQKDYVRKEDLDLHSLLVKGDCFLHVEIIHQRILIRVCKLLMSIWMPALPRPKRS